MKCGINTRVYGVSLDDKHILDPVESIKRLHDAGFESLDLSLGEPYDPDYPIKGEDWKERIDEIANTATKLGMTFSQIHLPYVRRGCKELDPSFQTDGYAEYYHESTLRAYQAAKMIGAPWAVAHCISPMNMGFDREKACAYNHTYFDPYIEYGIKCGVGTAFENMIQGINNHVKLRYCAHHSDLVEFVDSCNDPMVGICWDFGHANLTGLDQAASLRIIGKRLKVLHVQDNFGTADNHLAPFVGSIKWNEIFPVLAEIGYEGDCSLEVGGLTRRAPREVQDSFIKSAYASCRYLVDLVEQAKKDL